MKAQWLAIVADVKAWASTHPVYVWMAVAAVLVFGIGFCAGR